MVLEPSGIMEKSGARALAMRFGARRRTSASHALHLNSVDLNMVAVCLLHALGELLPVHAALLGKRAEALLHATLHALQPTHIDVGLLALHQLPHLVSELSHLRLDVHLLPRRVRLLS